MINPSNQRKHGIVFTAMSLLIALTIARTTMADEIERQANAIVSERTEYPLDFCIVSGEKLGSMGEQVVRLYDGREVRFCCESCVKPFEKDKKKWLKKLDAAMIAKLKESYPLKTCVVSGEQLGSMGEAVDIIYGNRLIKLCCKPCVAAFNSEPEKYVRMIDEVKP